MQFSIRLGRSQKMLLAELLKGSRSAHTLHEDMGWSEDRTEKALWRCYGLIGFTEEHFRRKDGNPCVKYDSFYIPDENLELVKTALENGGARFRKEIGERDLEVLTVVYERDKELREKYGNWMPRFTTTEIAKACDKGNMSIRRSFGRLLGLLGTSFLGGKKHKIVQVRGEDIFDTKYFYIRPPRWFVPTVRINYIEAILEKYGR